MVLGIREYPVDIDANKLIEFIDTNIENNSLTKNIAHVSKLTFTDGKAVSYTHLTLPTKA